MASRGGWDYETEEDRAERHALEDDWLRALTRLDNVLPVGSTEWATHGMLRHEIASSVARRVCRSELWDLNQMTGWHLGAAQMAVSTSVGTREEREKALRRFRALPGTIRSRIDDLRYGVGAGIRYLSPVGPLRIDTMLLSHPGYCLGYRLSARNRTVCYITDNELYPPEHPRRNPRYVDHLVTFVRGADSKGRVEWGFNASWHDIDDSIRVADVAWIMQYLGRITDDQLRAEHLVEQNPETGKYRLGLRIYELGALVSVHMDLHEAATPYLHELRSLTGETVQVAVLDGHEVVYVERLESMHTLRLFGRVGHRNQAHCTSTGKVLLAHLPEAERESMGSLAALGGVSRFPIRVKCASLAWHALRSALEGDNTVVSTEREGPPQTEGA